MATKRIVFITIVGLFAAISTSAQDNSSRIQIFGGVSVMRPSFPGDLGIMKSVGEDVLGTVPGWGASITVNVNRTFGITADLSGMYKHIDSIESYKVDASGNLHTFLFGPTVTLRRKRMSPFAHALFGIGRVSASENGSQFSFDETGFAASIGGGLDIVVCRHLAIRVVEADYFPYRHADGNSLMFNNMRWRAGIVIH